MVGPCTFEVLTIASAGEDADRDHPGRSPGRHIRGVISDEDRTGGRYAQPVKNGNRMGRIRLDQACLVPGYHDIRILVQLREDLPHRCPAVPRHYPYHEAHPFEIPKHLPRVWEDVFTVGRLHL